MSGTGRKYFGTDGVRGQVGVAPMTPDFVMHLGWAIGKMLSDSGFAGDKVIIGKDTRKTPSPPAFPPPAWTHTCSV